MISAPADTSLERRLAARLRALRADRGWSLDALAAASGVSRATLARLEKAEVAATTQMLGKLCAAYGLTLSQLIQMAEDAFSPLVRRDAQPVLRDAAIGFERRSVSPPSGTLQGEALDCTLAAGARVAYEAPPRPGLEHHLAMLEGRLTMTVDGQSYALQAGDCLRYRLQGASAFETPPETGARYLLFMV